MDQTIAAAAGVSLRPIKRIPRNSNLLRDLIGGREADPVDVFRQHVRIAPHLLDCLLPIGLEDSHRSAGAHTMAVPEQHDFPYLFRFLPCLLNSLPAFRTDPVDGLQFRDPVLVWVVGQTKLASRPESSDASGTCRVISAVRTVKFRPLQN
jgi:hypothetical protein